MSRLGSIATLEAARDRLDQPDAWRHEQPFLAALGFQTAHHTNGSHWRPNEGDRWQAFPHALRQFESALYVARLINPELGYRVHAPDPNALVMVTLTYGDREFIGAHKCLAVAAARALLSYAIAYRAQTA